MTTWDAFDVFGALPNATGFGGVLGSIRVAGTQHAIVASWRLENRSVQAVLLESAALELDAGAASFNASAEFGTVVD